MPSKSKSIYYYLVWGILAVALDQISKHLFLVSGLATINRDLAFSVSITNPLVVNAIALILFSAGIYFYAPRPVKSLPFVLIIAGGVSNIIDRITRLGVVDFIDLKIWPSFNLADSCIVVGACLMAYLLVKTPGKTISS